MEVQRFLTVCRRWWWLVMAGLAVTLAATVMLTGTPAREFESTASFVIQPQALQQDDQVKALDALVQGGTVGETYASIARSRLVRDRAEASLTPAERRQHMSVSAEVVTGTRLIRVTVRSTDPRSANRLARSISDETISYVDVLKDNYRLDPLDVPTHPKHPLPTHGTLTLVLGGILGLMFGVALAYAAQYWSEVRRAVAATKPGASTRGAAAESLWTPRKPAVVAGASPAGSDNGHGTEWRAPGTYGVEPPY